MAKTQKRKTRAEDAPDSAEFAQEAITATCC